MESTLKAKVIYVFGIDDKAHEGCLKIGEATVDEEADLFALTPNCDALNLAARKRISQYTQTAGIRYHLFHTELAMRTKNKRIQGFNDKAVHDVLLHEPRLVDRGSVTNRMFMGQNTRILELNSKSGFYPLYMAYTIWRERCR